MAGARPETIAQVSPAATRVTLISRERYSIELPVTASPERILPDLVAAGAAVVSLSPLRDTLEDFFVRQVAEAAAAAKPREDR